MKTYLLDRNICMANYWKLYFCDEPSVEVVCSDFDQFMRTTRVDCVVSPANSFGLMDGGYDLAITDWFGDQLQQMVQQYIIDNLYGEQTVGTSFIIDAGKDNQFLIHAPTMRMPQRIHDPLVIYSCMRTCLKSVFTCCLTETVRQKPVLLFKNPKTYCLSYQNYFLFFKNLYY